MKSIPRLSITSFLFSFVIGASALAAEHNIEIQNFKFNPAEITVQEGDTILFTNLDGAPHSVVPDPDTSPDAFEGSAILRTNQAFQLEVIDLASFDAKCGVHLRMPGLSVIVLSEAESLIKQGQEILKRLEVLVKEKNSEAVNSTTH